jgi:hypothetical protein
MVAAHLVARVATPETCMAWIERARRVTVRQLRKQVREALREAAASPRADADGAASVTGQEGGDRSELEPCDGGWDSEHVTVRFSVPLAIGVAIEEVRDLHRAVIGGEATLSDFFEAILAESFTGPVTPLVNEDWIGARTRPSLREARMERKGEGWTFLHVRLDGEELCEARQTLEDAARLCREVEDRSCPPDAAIRALIRLENEIELRIGDLLAMMGESGAWRGLCFSGVGHYAEERLGMSRSAAHIRCRMSRIFREREALREACEKGELGLEAASLAARAMSAAGHPAHEAAWIERAAESTVKRLREELRFVERDRALRSAGSSGGPVDDETLQRFRHRRAGQTVERLEHLVSAALDDPGAMESIHFRLPWTWPPCFAPRWTRKGAASASCAGRWDPEGDRLRWVRMAPVVAPARDSRP